MHTFETRRSGLIQLRVVSFVLSLLLFSSGTAAAWFTFEYFENADGVSGFIALIFILSSLWLFSLYHRAFTNSTVGVCNEGVTYRAILGHQRLLPWEDVSDLRLKGDNRDLEEVGAHFYDAQIILFRNLLSPNQGMLTFLSRWPFRITVPLFAYADPEAVLAYITYHLYPDAFEEVSADRVYQDQLEDNKKALLDEIYMLKQGRLRSERDARRVEMLTPTLRLSISRKLRIAQCILIVVGILCLCCPLVAGFVLADMEKFLLWKALTVYVPFFCGMASLALAVQLAAQCTALEALGSSRTDRDRIDRSGFSHH